MHIDKEFQDLLRDSLNDSSKKNRIYLVSFLIFLIYVLITTSNTTDLQFFFQDGDFTLPIVNVNISMQGFYFFSPILILILHFNLLTNLLEHANKFKNWNTYTKKPYDLLVDSFIFNIAFKKRSPNNKCYIIPLKIIFLSSITIAPLAILVFTTWVFSKSHSGVIYIHNIVVILDLFMSGFFLYYLYEKLNSKNVKNLLIGLLIIFTPLSFSNLFFLNELITYDHDAKISFLYPKISLPGVMLSEEPPYKLNEGIEDRYKCEIKFKNKSVHGRDFRFSAFRYAQIDSMNFCLTNLQKADFWLSNIKNSNFTGTNLENSFIGDAIIRSSSFSSDKSDPKKTSKLSGAIFSRSQLCEVQFDDAKLSFTEFFNAKLETVSFQNSNLQGARFTDATLDNVNFTNANLECACIPENQLQNISLTTQQVKDLFHNNKSFCLERKGFNNKSYTPDYCENENIKLID